MRHKATYLALIDVSGQEKSSYSLYYSIVLFPCNTIINVRTLYNNLIKNILRNYGYYSRCSISIRLLLWGLHFREKSLPNILFIKETFKIFLRIIEYSQNIVLFIRRKMNSALEDISRELQNANAEKVFIVSDSGRYESSCSDTLQRLLTSRKIRVEVSTKYTDLLSIPDYLSNILRKYHEYTHIRRAIDKEDRSYIKYVEVFRKIETKLAKRIKIYLDY